MQYSYLELAATRDEERVRRLDQRLNTQRALREPVIEPVVRASQVHDPLWLRLLDRIRPEHSLTPYACRLPSGDLGRTAIKLLNGEWTAVCVPDPRGHAGGSQAAAAHRGARSGLAGVPRAHAAVELG
jgi:hypothetical protein